MEFELPQGLLIVLLFNTTLIIIVFIINILNKLKINALSRKYEKFFNSGYDEPLLERMIESCIDQVEDVKNSNKKIINKINSIENCLLQSIQKVSIIRYNAFENIGGDQSYSIVLLDKNDNGIILSGIYSRNSSVNFAKPIENGTCKLTLTAEEIQAIDKAKNNYTKRTYFEEKQSS